MAPSRPAADVISGPAPRARNRLSSTLASPRTRSLWHVRQAAYHQRSARNHPLAEPWVSVENVAAHLGVAKDSVYRWIDVKGLPAHKIGKLWKFKLSEIDPWVRGGGALEGHETPTMPRKS